eukprot:CAMPEP_0167804080 /NCGR_PEP_ID=MMETSP0111_2-20121227/20251_1 /TAXON_ID=91324 /ORGANISM="Lotharella globosa, Strain CCCM811" /LENGTH=32 /DNA_ID= /DNA_START= /DNA_END= /DNA_ORIENTATION=
MTLAPHGTGASKLARSHLRHRARVTGSTASGM